MTFEQFCEKYSQEETCIQAFFSSRWPNGFRCPRCNHSHYYLINSRKLPLYECIDCHTQTSLIAGTILEGTRTSLVQWFQALFLHADPKGISAAQLKSIIGTTYKTAWLICHKIRHAMSSADSGQLLTGLIRVNWGVYGQPYNPTIYRHPQEQPLLAGASIGHNEQITQLKIKQVSDEHLIYDRIIPLASHKFVKQHIEPAAKDITIVIQKFSRQRFRPLIQKCLQASQWINLTFNGIGPKHLQSYLDQYCFAYNNWIRAENTFKTLVQHCAFTPTLKYPALISRKNNSALHKRDYINHLKNAC